MRNRQVRSSDDEDDVPLHENKRKRKMLRLDDEEDFELEEGELREYEEQIKKKEEPEMEDESEDDDDEEEEEESEDEDPVELPVHPIGDIVRVSGDGEWRRNHYDSFEYDGIIYNLIFSARLLQYHDVLYFKEDPVLLVPRERHLKPRVAILKDITQTLEGAMMVTGQWFYRLEDAKKSDGGNWQARTTREIFYSFHRDEESAECVLHKCVVHFIPSNKKLPNRKQHPGFIVQNVYDSEQKRLFKLTDREYDDDQQHEIDLLVQKTISLLGDLPDIEPGDNTVDQEDQRTNKLPLGRRNIPNMSPLNVSREDGRIFRSRQSVSAETPGRTEKYHAILSQHKVLTKETQRDGWLERLLQAIEFMCMSMDSKKNDGKEKRGADGISIINKISCSNLVNRSHDKTPNSDMSIVWPDAAVNAIAALEKAAHDGFSSDYQKYKQKLRHLTFYLKNNAVLARRVLSGELEPSHILKMSPNELKEGLTAEEMTNLRSRGTCR